jgi:hypothetical protein
MIKKVLKWFGIGIGVIIALILIVSIVVMIVVDKEMVEEAMEGVLDRQVRIKEFSVGLFSALSGIEVRKIQISNYKSTKQLENLRAQPVTKEDLFVELEEFKFKISFIPLLFGNVVLNELMLYKPKINIVRYRNGAFNFSDLLIPKTLSPEEKKKLESERKKQIAKNAKQVEKRTEPITTDNLSLEVTVGKVGIENGQINLFDVATKQHTIVYNLTAKIYDIKIDPQHLNNKNQVNVFIDMGIKTVGQASKASVQSYDIGLQANGRIIPFDIKSRRLNPEILLKIGTPYCSITGLQIFDSMKTVSALQKYSGEFDFLKKTIQWKNGFIKIWYKNDLLKLQEGVIRTDDINLTYSGTVNIEDKRINLNTDLILDSKYTKKVQRSIKKKLDRRIKGKLKKYVSAEKASEIAIKPFLNEEKKINVVYQITGTMDRPRVKMVKPVLGSLNAVIKDVTGDVAKMVEDEVKREAEEKAKKLVDEKMKEWQKKVQEKMEEKLKKLYK